MIYLFPDINLSSQEKIGPYISPCVFLGLVAVSTAIFFVRSLPRKPFHGRKSSQYLFYTFKVDRPLKRNRDFGVRLWCAILVCDLGVRFVCAILVCDLYVRLWCATLVCDLYVQFVCAILVCDLGVRSWW